MKQAGITLIEMLVAIAILVLIFAIVLNMYGTAYEVSEMAPLRLESVRKASMLFAQIRKDLAGAFAYANGGDATNFRIVDSGAGYPSRDELTFVTSAGNGTSSAFVEVSYYLDPTKKLLYRIERSYLTCTAEPATIADEPFVNAALVPDLKPYILAFDVGSFEIKARPSPGAALADSWVGQPNLPRVVRVTITTESGATIEESAGNFVSRYKQTHMCEIIVPNGG